MNFYTRQDPAGFLFIVSTHVAAVICKLLWAWKQEGFLHMCIASAKTARTTGGSQAPLSPCLFPWPQEVAWGSKGAKMGAFWSPRLQTPQRHCLSLHILRDKAIHKTVETQKETWILDGRSIVCVHGYKELPVTLWHRNSPSPPLDALLTSEANPAFRSYEFIFADVLLSDPWSFTSEYCSVSFIPSLVADQVGVHSEKAACLEACR